MVRVLARGIRGDLMVSDMEKLNSLSFLLVQRKSLQVHTKGGVPAQTLQNVLIIGTEVHYRAYFSKYPKEEPLTPKYTEVVRVLARKSRNKLIISEDRGGIASEPW